MYVESIIGRSCLGLLGQHYDMFLDPVIEGRTPSDFFFYKTSSWSTPLLDNSFAMPCGDPLELRWFQTNLSTLEVGLEGRLPTWEIHMRIIHSYFHS